jgi:hypothetical protein
MLSEKQMPHFFWLPFDGSVPRKPVSRSAEAK